MADDKTYQVELNFDEHLAFDLDAPRWLAVKLNDTLAEWCEQELRHDWVLVDDSTWTEERNAFGMKAFCPKATMLFDTAIDAGYFRLRWS